MVKRYVESAFSNPNTYGGIATIYHVVNTAGMSRGHAAHTHSQTIEICYVAKGLLNWWVGDSTYEIHAGDVVVMMPDVPHGSSDSTLQPCEYYSVHIDPLKLPASAQMAARTDGFGGYHALQSEAGDAIRRIFHEHENPLPFSEEVCSSLLTILCTSLARTGMAAHRPESDNYLVYRATRLLQQTDGDPLSVEDVAERLRVSTVWLTKVFQKELGLAPGEWIRSRKLEEAKRLLRESDESVVSIAVRLGFGSSQYFATAFRKNTGLSPSDYRERIRLAMISPDVIVRAN